MGQKNHKLNSGQFSQEMQLEAQRQVFSPNATQLFSAHRRSDGIFMRTLDDKKGG